MRIAVWHNLPSGGGKRALYDHVKGLVSRGHYVEAWCPPSEERSFLSLSEIIRENIVELENTEKPAALERLQIALQMNRSIAAMDRHCAKCAKEIAKGDFDVLFANACSLYRTTAIGRLTKLPSLIYLGEPYRWLYEAMPNNFWAALPRQSLLSIGEAKKRFLETRRVRNGRVQVREEISNAAAFDKILCNSIYSLESIGRAYNLRAEVCYLGIDNARFAAAASTGSRSHYLGLAAVVREKNVDLCLRAVGELPRSHRKPLVWIGNVVDHAYMLELEGLAAKLGVDFKPRIRVSEGELLSTLAGAEALIYAPKLEPFGLAPLEAFACGVPVVACAEGGVRETVINEQTGLLVPNSSAGLAAGLMRLARDGVLRSKLTNEARCRVESFWSNDRGIDRLEDALRSLRKKPCVA